MVGDTSSMRHVMEHGEYIGVLEYVTRACKQSIERWGARDFQVY